MCRIAKVLIVAPADKHADLRRALGSLEYDIVATVASAEGAEGITADTAVLWEPEADAVTILRQRGVKTVAITAEDVGADMHLKPDELTQFKTRIWELFAPD